MRTSESKKHQQAYDSSAVLGFEELQIHRAWSGRQGEAAPAARIAVRRPDTTAFAAHLASRFTLGQLGKHGERPPIRLAVTRRLEHRAGLTRIGIKAEHQKLGGERAEIDEAANQRLRIAPFHLS